MKLHKVDSKKRWLTFIGLAFCCLLMLCGFGVFRFAPISFVFAEENTSSTEIPFDREQIKIDSVTLSADKQTAKAEENVALNFQVEPYYSRETITSIEYKIISGKNYATVSNDGILSISTFAKAYENVGVKVVVNQVESNIISIYIAKTPVEEFEIIASKTTIREGGSAQISVNKLVPITSSFQKVRFEIVEGGEFATIDANTGFVQVSSEVNNSNATVKVRALTCENFEKSSNEITLSIYVPVKNIVLKASTNLVSISSTQGQYVTLSAAASGVVSEFNPTYVLDPDYSDVATLTDNVLFIHSDLKQSYIIPVWAEQDGAESNMVYIEVYILTEEIQLKESENLTSVFQFLDYDFSAKTVPSYANAQTFTYLLTAENGEQITYAGVSDNGLIWIGDCAPVGSKLQLTISNADITRTISLTILEYDTQSIVLMNADLPSILYPTNEVTFTAMLDNQFVTNNHFTVEFESGDLDVFTITKNNTITIKNLSALEELGKNKLSFNVRLKSLTGKYSAVQNFTVKLPVVTMENQTIYADRGDTIYIDMFFNSKNFASNKTLEDLTNQILNGETVIIRKTSTVGQIELILPTKLRYEIDNFVIPVYSEDGNRTCTINVIINAIETSNIVATLAKTDSESYAIDEQNPELWINRSIKTTFTYNGKGGIKSIHDYGLSFYSAAANNAIQNYSSNELTLTADNAKGGELISYSIVFYDGTQTAKHTLERNLKVFNPASSTNGIYIQDNTITMLGVWYDLNTAFKFNDTNDSVLTKWITTGGKAEISYNNVLKIITSTPWSGFDAIIHYSQTYNGKSFEMGQTSFKVNIGFSKTADIVYKAAGESNDMWVQGLKDEFEQTGGFLGIGNHGMSGSNSNELSGGLAYGQFYNIYNLYDWQKLKEIGFTKIRLTLQLDIKEYEDGYQEVYALLDNDTNLSGFSFSEVWRNGYVEHTPNARDTSWWTHTFTFDVPIDLIIQKPNLVIACGAHGYGNDTWNWGFTRINFEAVA